MTLIATAWWRTTNATDMHPRIPGGPRRPTLRRKAAANGCADAHARRRQLRSAVRAMTALPCCHLAATVASLLPTTATYADTMTWSNESAPAARDERREPLGMRTNRSGVAEWWTKTCLRAVFQLMTENRQYARAGDLAICLCHDWPKAKCVQLNGGPDLATDAKVST